MKNNKSKNSKNKLFSAPKKESQAKLPKMVLTPLEKQETPLGALWRLQLLTYWLAEAIQSRSRDCRSSRFYSFFEGDRRTDLIHSFQFKPEPNGQSLFENKITYYLLASRITMQAYGLRSLMEDNSLYLNDILYIEQRAYEMEKIFYKAISEAKSIDIKIFQELVKFKSMVDNLTICNSAIETH